MKVVFFWGKDFKHEQFTYLQVCGKSIVIRALGGLPSSNA